MKHFTDAIEASFKPHRNVAIAHQQKAYMRNQFEFFGLKTPLRNELQKDFLKKGGLPRKQELEPIVKELWNKPQREFQYLAQELSFKYIKKLEESDITLFEYMVVQKSWWDTVDFIAVKLMGAYFKKYPEQILPHNKKWLASQNIWLQRSSLLFQLKYKNAIDSKLLGDTINSLLGSKEFFINKAIGWVLREYSKTNPDWVLTFVAETKLNALSKKEALRLIKKSS